MSTTLLGIIGLVWSVIKLIGTNETVNKALDNWTKGTSNQLDDQVWALLEKAMGMEDHVAKAAMLEDGLKAIEDQYLVAKQDELLLRATTAPRHVWNPPTLAEIQALLTGETAPTGDA